MSVFVKDIDVPSDCDGCWHPTCNLWLQTDVGKRHKDCPISPMPEKHGRLIDADEATRGSLERTGKRLLAIDTAPTIVEAEE